MDSANPHFQRIKGLRNYELTNHLGNVLVTVTDRRPWITSGSCFGADVVSANDYYEFGSEMVGRTWQAGDSTNYKYSFNGKLKDDEVYGDGNFQDYGMRMYDTRTNRFISVDPLTAKYPWYSPFQFAGDKPIRYIDLDGLEEPDGDVIGRSKDVKEIEDNELNEELTPPRRPTPLNLAGNGLALNRILFEPSPTPRPLTFTEIIENENETRQNEIHKTVEVKVNEAQPDASNVARPGTYPRIYTQQPSGVTNGTTLKPAESLNEQLNNSEAKIQEAAKDAYSQATYNATLTGSPTFGRTFGINVHSIFEDIAIQKLGPENAKKEISYLNHRVVEYGTPGSVRVDIVVGNPAEPTAIYDLKTGTAQLTPERIDQLRKNLPEGFQGIPVKEIIPENNVIQKK